MLRILAALLLAPALLADAPPQGSLCFPSTDEPCRNVRRERVSVERREVPRTFVWVRGDGRDVVAGVIPANARSIDLTDAPVVAGAIAIDRDRWPADVVLRIGTHAWTVSGAAPEFALLVTGVNAGDHDLLVSADHHAAHTAHVRISDRATQLGRIVLRRLPVISGRVVDRASGEGLLGARVVSKEQQSTSATGGEFELEIDGEWPDHVRIEHEGYGTRIVPVPKTVADVFLGPIDLAPGATLVVAAEVDATAELSFEGQRIGSHPLPATFAALSTGKYHVLIRGKEPLERYGTTVEIESAGTTVPLHIEIEPLEVQLRVTQKRQPVAGASVDVDSRDGEWRESITTNAEGTYDATFWQRGAFVAFVDRAVVHANLSNQDVWEIRLPEHRIAGTVADAKSGRGIAGATIFLKTDAATTSTLLRTSSDDQGRFEYASVETGQQTLSAEAPGYLGAKTSFALDAQESERSVSLSLARAVKKSVRVLLANGAPAVGALVAMERDRPAIPLVTDAAGRAEITVGEGAAQFVYVAPRDGSFAIARVGEGEETIIRVPPGEASIIVRTSIPNVHLELRYDGHAIPLSVLDDLGNHQGRPFRTDSDGRLVLEHMPLGVYEIRRALSPDATARLAVQPGMNSVILTFARRSGGA